MRIFKSPNILRKCYPEALWKVDTSERKIYLTFDDGPHPEITSMVLELLSEFEATACFFCTGSQVSRYPEMYSQLISSGNICGNHTYNHLNGWKATWDEYVKDVLKTTYEFQSEFFRPPYGKMKFSQYESLKEKFKIVMWDVVTYDWDAQFDKEKCLRSAVKNSEEGSIIVFHDSIKAHKNLEFVLPRYLQEFKDRGYEFSSLEDSVELQQTTPVLSKMSS